MVGLHAYMDDCVHACMVACMDDCMDACIYACTYACMHAFVCVVCVQRLSLTVFRRVLEAKPPRVLFGALQFNLGLLFSALSLFARSDIAIGVDVTKADASKLNKVNPKPQTLNPKPQALNPKP